MISATATTRRTKARGFTLVELPFDKLRTVRFGRLKAVRQGERGAFTLIELLVVISVISLLVAIGASTALRAQRSARRATGIALITTLNTALLQYQSDHSMLPPSYHADYDGSVWYGSQTLVQAMVGYLDADLDGKDGEGWRKEVRGTVYGSYVVFGKMKTQEHEYRHYTPRLIFVDPTGNPVLYYRFDAETEGFLRNDNRVDGPGDPNAYARRGNADLPRRDFLLMSRGFNGDWWSGGDKDDDFTNFSEPE